LLFVVWQKLREQVIIMKEYFLQCSDALRSKLLVQVRNEFLDFCGFYSGYITTG